MSALAILWYFLIFLLIAGYFILDGFDLGVGTLFPFLCKDERDKEIARRAIGPVWDGNEVWLLTAGGALFAAFPDAYATTFSGFYLAIMLVLFGLIVRAVSFEFHAGDKKWRKVWDVCFFLGSALPALLFGVALGNVVAGIPMDAAGNYIGVPLLGLISPFTLLTGLLGLAMFMAAGACWLALKAPVGSELQMRAAKLRRPLQLVALVLFVIASVYLFAMMSGRADGFAPDLMIVRYLFAALFLACLLASIFVGRVRVGHGEAAGTVTDGAIGAKSDLVAFVMQSASAGALVFLVAFSMFPVLVFATADGVGGPIDLMNAGASELSLFCMTVILCIGLPLVLVYHVLIYRTFRGRVALESE